MLEIRPSCENCNTALPPHADDAMICSFECTFCADCVERVLHNVCPNCGGGFEKRPVRPQHNWKGGNDVAHHPASQAVKHRPVNSQSHTAFARDISKIPAVKR